MLIISTFPSLWRGENIKGSIYCSFQEIAFFPEIGEKDPQDSLNSYKMNSFFVSQCQIQAEHSYAAAYLGMGTLCYLIINSFMG